MFSFFMLYIVYLCQRYIRLTLSDLRTNPTFKGSSGKELVLWSGTYCTIYHSISHLIDEEMRLRESSQVQGCTGLKKPHRNLFMEGLRR